jgi:hypothetical protein
MSRIDLSWQLVSAIGLAALVLAVGCSSSATPTPTPAPAAGAVLQRILGDCWGVTEYKDLDGTRPDHVRGFECARTRLLGMAQLYPEAAESHRILAWGFLYADKDEAAAQAEYQRAAQIYAAQGNTVDEADILVRIAVQITMQHDQQTGCNLLEQAAKLDPQNSRVPIFLRNFECIPLTAVPLATVPLATVTPVTQATLPLDATPTPRPTIATP